MAYAGAAILVVSILGCWLTSTQVSGAGNFALGLIFALVAVLPVLLYLQEKGKLYLRDSLLTILWALFFTFMLGFPVTVAARLGMGIGLQDLRFAQWDGWLGVHVPDLAA
jgi:multisubunit Na+/H+ antiporter MnhE subunit